MTIPAGVATVTITFDLGAAGVAAGPGSIEFAPSVPVAYAGLSWVNTLAPFSATITAAGTGSIVLPATDDAAGNPDSWTYRVTERFGGGRPAFSIAVLSANGSTQDYSSIVPIPSSSGVAVVVGPPGPVNPLGIGAVTTVATGGAATASVTGVYPGQVLNVGLPIGATGPYGGTVVTDPAIAAIVGDPASDTATVLNSAFVPQAGGHITGPLYVRAANNVDPVVIKPSGDGQPAVWNLINDDSVGFVLHIVTGAGAAPTGPGGLLGLGVSATGAKGLVIDVVGNCVGQAIDMFPGSAGTGLRVTTEDVAEAVHIYQTAPSGITAGCALSIQAQNLTPPADQVIVWIDSAALAGTAMGAPILSIDAATGTSTFFHTVLAKGTSVIARDVTYVGALDYNNAQSKLGFNALRFATLSSVDDYFFHKRVAAVGTELRFDMADYLTTGWDGNSTWDTAFAIGHDAGANKLGFFGATPAFKPTGVAVDAAGIHAALVTLGLIAA